MKLGIMQPYFFPYIGYFQLINAVDKFVLYDDVNFIKQGWINRNRILLNGQPHYFTLGLKNASSYKKINEIEISINADKLLKTIYQAYNKTPYFYNIYPIIAEILNYKELNLAKFVSNSIFKISSYLGIDTEIIVSSEKSISNELKSKERVLAICNFFGAANYLNAIGGVDIYSKEEFSNYGIKLYFIRPNEITYQQFKDNFITNLSIIDVIMFNSKETINEMLTMFALV